jgi:hypothetical protein
LSKPFPLILTEGGDDRLVLNKDTHVNKYFCSPELSTDVLFRGSCTCNLPTPSGYEAASNLYDQFKNESITIEQSMSSTRKRLIEAYDLPKQTGVFLMPSGSDAEYIPLLITKVFNPGKKIVNIVTCNEEVGSGTLDAAGGKLFSPVEPIAGYTEGASKTGDPVKGLNDDVRTVAINARMPNGDVVDKNEQINTIMQEC